jgi:hypothetical protein
MIKAHSRLCAAIKAAKGEPILAVGSIFISGIKSWTEISILHDRRVKGWISVQSLNLLGNSGTKIIDWKE